MYEEKKLSIYSHVPEFRHRHSYLVSLLFAAPIPTLVIFKKFLALYTMSCVLMHVSLSMHAMHVDISSALIQVPLIIITI